MEVNTDRSFSDISQLVITYGDFFPDTCIKFVIVSSIDSKKPSNFWKEIQVFRIEFLKTIQSWQLAVTDSYVCMYVLIYAGFWSIF